MQQHKRGNPHKRPRKRNRLQTPILKKPLAVARLTLHEADPVTGQEDDLSTLFYEYYRGYTIYSSEQGQCCMHGRDGCLRIQGKYVAFPDIEEAKMLIKHFLADGRSAQESMYRSVPAQEYICLNRRQAVAVRVGGKIG